jgi:hypothetical protein
MVTGIFVVVGGSPQKKFEAKRRGRPEVESRK